MDEARRFLRYLIPGTLFVAEVWVLVRIALPGWRVFDNLQVNSGISLALAGLLATAAAGFVLSAVHHVVLNSLYGKHLNYVRAVRHAASVGSLAVVDVASGELWGPMHELTRRQALAIVTAVWHQLPELSPRLKSANLRAEELTNLAHSMGAAFVASLAAPAAVILAAHAGHHEASAEGARLAFALFVVLAVSWVIWRNRERTFEFCERFVESCFTDALAELNAEERPFRTSFRFDPPLSRRP